MTQENALKLFKCLSDTSRLRIVQALTQGEMYTELLAERLGLTPSTVSFHMKKMEDAGVAVSRKEQYYTVYSLNREVLDKTLYEAAVSEPEQADEQLKREEEYRRKVLRAFFEYGRVYEEKEVNEIISPIHEDYCTIRRDMISEGIFRRDGTRYVRLK